MSWFPSKIHFKFHPDYIGSLCGSLPALNSGVCMDPLYVNCLGCLDKMRLSNLPAVDAVLDRFDQIVQEERRR